MRGTGIKAVDPSILACHVAWFKWTSGDLHLVVQIARAPLAGSPARSALVGPWQQERLRRYQDEKEQGQLVKLICNAGAKERGHAGDTSATG